LPKSIDRLLHIFPKKPAGSAGDLVRNFFHVDDCFVVDDSLKDSWTSDATAVEAMISGPSTKEMSGPLISI